MNQHLNFPQPFILPLFVHIKAYPCVLFKINISLVLDWFLVILAVGCNGLVHWQREGMAWRSVKVLFMSYGPMDVSDSSSKIQNLRAGMNCWIFLWPDRVFQTHEFCEHAKTSESDVKYIPPKKTRGCGQKLYFIDSGLTVHASFGFFKDVFIAKKNNSSSTSLHKQATNQRSPPLRASKPSHFGNLSSSVFQESPAIPRESDEEVRSQKTIKTGGDWHGETSLGWRWWSWDLNVLDESAVFFHEFFSKSKRI